MVLHPEINLSVKLTEIGDSQELNRNKLRKLLLDELLKERAGTGRGDETSKYRYNVEMLSSGNKIYLTRPVPLNKGFDFVIHVEDYIFLNGKDNPRHDDIFNDLALKKNKDNHKFNELYDEMERVFLCEEPDEVITTVDFNEGYSVDLILKVIKWFFIEQDVRYWNWSGRNMFMNGIKEIKNQ